MSSTESVCPAYGIWLMFHSPPSCGVQTWIFFLQSPVANRPVKPHKKNKSNKCISKTTRIKCMKSVCPAYRIYIRSGYVQRTESIYEVVYPEYRIYFEAGMPSVQNLYTKWVCPAYRIYLRSGYAQHTESIYEVGIPSIQNLFTKWVYPAYRICLRSGYVQRTESGRCSTLYAGAAFIRTRKCVIYSPQSPNAPDSKHELL